MNRSERSQEIQRLEGELAGVRHAVLLDFRGVTVPQVTELRAQIRKSGGHYEVVKNTLLGRAVAGAPLARLKEHMKGPTAIAWSASEPVALAKTLSAFAKAVPRLQVKAVLLDGAPVAANQLEMVASLPAMPELRARLLGLLVSPMRRFVTVVGAPSRNLVGVLGQRAEQMK